MQSLKGFGPFITRYVLSAAIMFGLLTTPIVAVAADEALKPDKIFVVTDYRFDEQSLPGAPPVVRALCGTRCNALSANVDSYMVYMMRGEWQLRKVASNLSRDVPLDNPYLAGGRCICIGDEYLVEPYVSPGFHPPSAKP